MSWISISVRLFHDRGGSHRRVLGGGGLDTTKSGSDERCNSQLGRTVSLRFNCAFYHIEGRKAETTSLMACSIAIFVGGGVLLYHLRAGVEAARRARIQ